MAANRLVPKNSDSQFFLKDNIQSTMLEAPAPRGFELQTNFTMLKEANGRCVHEREEIPNNGGCALTP
jgi:hypothetical protein